MRFLNAPIELPLALIEAIERAFLGNTPEHSLPRLGAALKILWPRLAKDRGQEKQNHYSLAATEAEAYAAYYLPANSLKLPVVLAEAEGFGLKLWAERSSHHRWVDVGSGPGTALAGLSFFANQSGIPIELTSIDQSKTFLHHASQLHQQLRQSFPDARLQHNAELAPREAHALRNKIIEKKPNFISFLNSIGEIFPVEAERAKWVTVLIEDMFRLAKAEQEPRWLLIIEPGSNAASRELLALREQVKSLPGVAVMLPCFDARPCGAFANARDWCHEEVAIHFPDWHAELGARAGLRNEAMLFSYLLLRIGGSSATELSGSSRMVSQRMERKGLTECWFCTPSGKLKARFSNAIQRKRELPIPLPIRGDSYRTISFSDKGEVESAEPLPMAKNIVWAEP